MIQKMMMKIPVSPINKPTNKTKKLHLLPKIPHFTLENPKLLIPTHYLILPNH